MSAAGTGPQKPKLGRGKRRALWALLVVIAVDQLLLWTLATRPVKSLRELITLTQSPDPPYFELRKNLSTTYESWGRGAVTQIHTNALGLRDPPRDIALAEGQKRVVATGDSITFGIGVGDDEPFPRHMERLLHERGMRHVEVWNAGIPGYSMADHLGFLRRHILSYRPSAILLQLSRNDNALPMPLSPAFMTALRFSGLARLWMIYRFNFVEDPALFRSSLQAYVRECEAAGVRLALAYEGLPEENREEVKKLSFEHHLPLIEIGGEAYPKLPDDPHYNPVGHKNVAARLLPEVLSLLERP